MHKHIIKNTPCALNNTWNISKQIKNACTRIENASKTTIRRAFAQGVSDHAPPARATMRKFRTITQTWTQKWAAVPVSCSDSCFLLRLLFLAQTIFDFGVAAREPRAIGIGCRLRLSGQLFLGIFLERLFSPKYDILDENRLQNGAQMGSCWTYFSEKVWKWKSVFGLRRRVRIAYEPIPKSAWCDQQITKKTDVFQIRIFFIKNMKMC